MSDFAFLKLQANRTSNIINSSSATPQNIGQAPTCPECGRFVGLCRWLPPYRIEFDARVKVLPHAVMDVGPELFLSTTFLAHAEELGHRIRTDYSATVSGTNGSWKDGQLRHVVIPRLHYEIDFARSSVKQSRIDDCRHCLGGEFHAGNSLFVNCCDSIPDIFVVDAMPGRILVKSSLAKMFDLCAGDVEAITTNLLTINASSRNNGS